MSGNSGRARAPIDHRHRGAALPLLAMFTILLAIALPALAADGISDLGKPTDDVPGIGERLDGFVRIAPVHRNQRKVTVYLFDSLWDAGSAEMRWPLVKALDQFGTWSGLAKGQENQALATPRPGDEKVVVPPLPTFDLSQAHYRSSYVVFVHRVIQAHPKGPIARLSPKEEALFQRATHLTVPSYPESDPHYVDRYPLPGMVVGSYAHQGPFEVPGALESPGNHVGVPVNQQWYTFDNIQHIMQLGHGEFWVQELNAFANTMTALVCAQDGNRPAKVCRRPELHYILTQKH